MGSSFGSAFSKITKENVQFVKYYLNGVCLREGYQSELTIFSLPEIFCLQFRITPLCIILDDVCLRWVLPTNKPKVRMKLISRIILPKSFHPNYKRKRWKIIKGITIINCRHGKPRHHTMHIYIVPDGLDLNQCKHSIQWVQKSCHI